MGVEIERKFLVNKEQWDQLVKPTGQLIRQGYLLTDPLKTIRIRVTGETACLTIKGINTGPARAEFEYPIPREEAIELLDLFSQTELSKIRYEIVHDGKRWEVDEFLGENKGLLVAEIELAAAAETFTLPDWAGPEVTGDEKYYNSNLTLKPYTLWTGS
jgi:adenylate cyclase